MTPWLCPPDSSDHGVLQTITGSGGHFLLQGFSQPRDRTHISWGSCLSKQIFTTEPNGKPTVRKEILYLNLPLIKTAVFLHFTLWPVWPPQNTWVVKHSHIKCSPTSQTYTFIRKKSGKRVCPCIANLCDGGGEKPRDKMDCTCPGGGRSAHGGVVKQSF